MHHLTGLRQQRIACMKPTVFIQTSHKQLVGALVSAYSLRRNSRFADAESGWGCGSAVGVSAGTRAYTTVGVTSPAPVVLL